MTILEKKPWKAYKKKSINGLSTQRFLEMYGY